MTTPLTTRVIQMHQLFHLLPKNWVGRSPPYFAQGIPGMTPKNLDSFVKVLRTVSEIFGILLSEPIGVFYLNNAVTRYSFTLCHSMVLHTLLFILQSLRSCYTCSFHTVQTLPNLSLIDLTSSFAVVGSFTSALRSSSCERTTT